MNATFKRGRTIALLLILAGAFLFLDNIGIIPIHNLDAFWPVWMIVVGALIFEHRPCATAAIWAAGWVVAGVLLILGNLRILPVNEDVIWPILLIVIGTNMLIRPTSIRDWGERMRHASEQAREARFERRRTRREHRSHWMSSSTSNVYPGDRMRESIVFSALNRRVETQQFEGGSLDVVFGSIEIDLRNAAVASPDRRVQIEANAVFAGIEIMVPMTWKVLLQATAVFGGCENKTLPPRPEPGIEPVTLIVTGGAVFGGITIQN
jgi:predicted membrane protein